MRRFVYYGASSAGATLLLDLYPATAAYSLRKLRTAYTDAAIRVRRSSDNAEQDIGFVGGVLNTSSLLDFVGAGNGFVTTWYDQQGSNNLTQGSSSAQPQIVSSGATILRGGKPSVKFDGSNDFLQNISSAFLNKISTSYFSVSNNDVVDGRGVIHTQYTLSNTTIRTFCDRSILKSHAIITNNSPVNFPADLSIVRSGVEQRLLSSFIDSLKNVSTFDNSAIGGTNTYTLDIQNNGLRLGSQAGVTFLNGTIQEFIGYNTHESANRTAIETNINDYYAIY